MPRVLASHPTAELVVVGDGPLRGHYERRARGVGGNIRFVGRVYDERPEYYGTSDLYLCPTDKASFGITLLEAMACGTPMVVSNITGFHELIDGGDEAVLVPPADPDAWADAINRLLRDPARRTQMGRAGYAKAARYAWSEVATRVLRTYERVAR
jgi:phosphatidylinositol alpha-mannosyltransferase